MKRDYTNAERAFALETLANTNGNLAATARLTGFPRKTIAYWANQTGVRGLVVAPAKEGTEGEENVPVRRMGTYADRQEMAETWRKAALLNLEELTNADKVKKAPLHHNVIAAGTAQDKLNLLTGHSTQRTESLRIELVAGGSLRELGERAVSGQIVPPKALQE
jgi:transposase-like protein